MTNPPDLSSPGFSPVPGQQTNGPNSAPGASCAGSPFPRDGLPWTETEDESLRVAWADPAWTYAHIGEALSRSPSKVKGRANKLNLGTRPKRAAPRRKASAGWTDADCAKLVKLREQGISNRKIGLALGRTRGAIEQKVRQMRLPFRLRPVQLRPAVSPPPPQNPINEAELLRRGINPQTVALLRRMK